MRSDRLRRRGATARPGWAYLVGAGPGDPDLITVRGEQLLATADVVLHDELVDPILLERASGQLLPVGKRGSDQQSKDAKQKEIIEEMLRQAASGRSVVRLKGGDPFVFGRGAEEAEALQKAGIPFEVVPGVVSPVGATAYAGVPLTHRSLASSVTFVTAVCQNGADFDWQQLQNVCGTICIFMGHKRLAAISDALIQKARFAADTPATMIEKISYPSQRSVTGTLKTIAARVEEAQLGTPSLLVLGKVVGLRDKLRWFERRPLFGKRILLTRPAAQIEDTRQLFRRRGARVVALPLIDTQPPANPQQVDELVDRIQNYDLILFTSVNGVRWLWRSIQKLGRDARVFGNSQVGVIGPATATALQDHGIQADFVAEKHVAEELVVQVCSRFGEGTRVLLPRAQIAREVLPKSLREAGMKVDVVPVYQTVSANREQLTRALASCDIITLTSSSTAEKLMEACGGDLQLLANKSLASIGPITTATAEKLGMRVAVTASVHDTEGLADAMEDYFQALPAPD